MKESELRKNVEKVAALMDLYEEAARKKGFGSRDVELRVTKEQIVEALVETKKVLVEMERETENV